MSDENTRTRTRERTDETEEQHTSAACPECSGHLIADEEHGETVCDDCGLVVDEGEIDRGPEWRAFDSSEKDNKVARRRPDDEHDARQGPVHQHRLARQRTPTATRWAPSSVRRCSACASGTSGSAPATPRSATSPSAGRDRPHGQRPRPARERPRDRVGHLSPCPRRKSPARPVHRGRLDGLRLRRRAPGRRPAFARRIADVSRVEKSGSHGPTATSSANSAWKSPRRIESYVPRFASSLGMSDEAEHAPGSCSRTPKEQGVHLVNRPSASPLRPSTPPRYSPTRRPPGRRQRGGRHLRSDYSQPVPRTPRSRTGPSCGLIRPRRPVHGAVVRPQKNHI